MSTQEERNEKLIGLGLIYNGESFVYEDINVHWTELVTLRDEEFDSLVEKIKPVLEQRKSVDSSLINIVRDEEPEEEAESSVKLDFKGF